MKNNKQILTLLLGLVLIGLPAAAKEKSKKGKAAEPAMDPAMMQKWMAYSTPGDAHKALSPLVGSFNHKMKSWMAADSKPEESAGTTDAQWIMGGRFVESVVKGVAMGQPFEGRSIVGYDNEKKQYTSFWIDTMATGSMTMQGQYDAASKTLTETGSASCPMEGTKSFRGVTKIIDDNNHTYEMYTNGKDGKEFKMMEITYTRK